MSHFLILLLFSFSAFGQEASKTGVLPRDFPPELQPKSEKQLPSEDSSKKSEEEVTPLIPENSNSSKETIEVSTPSQRVQESNFQNIYSAPIVIEEEQKPSDNFSNDFNDEYNNVLIESAPIYQKIQEDLSRSSLYRWGISADVTPFTSQAVIDLVILDVSSNFGWKFSKFEVGPFISVSMDYRLERVGRSVLRDLDLIAGGFIEYNFISWSQSRQMFYPALGIELAYNRLLDHNRFYTRPYVVAKTFLSESVALAIDLGFEWRVGFGYAIEDIWGIHTNIGFLKYF